MLTIKGVYDGKTIRPLPGEPLPQVQGTVPVEITFLSEAEVLHSWGETLAKLQAERGKIPPRVSAISGYNGATLVTGDCTALFSLV